MRVNVMSAVASRGALWFTVFTQRFTAPVFTAFLDRMARQADRKVHVVADRHPVHRSKAVRAWLQDNAERVELHLMPGYSPELNPDELLGRRPQTRRQRLTRPQPRPPRPPDPTLPAPP
ncbi:transposase, partial [Actinokineospora pegani]|uniref:transposase n=1 Tax=Actinokineospora pegani TaxID=2654637 RepID=UPI0022A7C41D